MTASPEASRVAHRRAVQLLACERYSPDAFSTATDLACLPFVEARDVLVALASVCQLFMDKTGYLRPDRLAGLLDQIERWGGE